MINENFSIFQTISSHLFHPLFTVEVFYIKYCSIKNSLKLRKVDNEELLKDKLKINDD